MKLCKQISLQHVFFAVFLLAAVQGCKSAPPVIPPDLSAAETFQRAQDAADSGNYALAIRYYAAFRQSHPENTDRDVWAQYEIAFNYHKMGKNTVAIGLLGKLLQEYQTGGDSLPPAPRILAQKLRDRLSAVAGVSAPVADRQSTPATAASSTSP